MSCVTAAVRSSRPSETSATSGTSTVTTLPIDRLSMRMSMNLPPRPIIGTGLLCCSLLPTLMTTSGFFGKSSELNRAAGGEPTHSGCVSGKLAKSARACVTGMPSSSASFTALAIALPL